MSLSVISLFSGLGGLDYGFEAAGFKTRAAVELDRPSCAAIRRNSKWPLLDGDIHEITSRQILRAGELRKGAADVLIGGPPCQPFSKSGYWASGDAGRLDDPRADTLTAYVRVLRDTKPQAFLIENVKGLVYKNKDEGLRHLIDGVEQVNREAGTRYRVNWACLNAADYGVPQLRERVFLIGSRDGRDFQFPQPTHGESASPGLFDSQLEPYKTAWDALGDLPADPDEPSLVVNGKWGALLPSIPEGENYLWHTSRGGGKPLFGWRTRYWSFLLKLAKRLPAWTIQAQPGTSTGPFHWRSRRLSVREMCRIQTIPDKVTLDCGRTDAQRLIGNAVPSLLGEVLALEIRRQLLDAPARRKKPRLLPARLEPLPKPERLRPVPAKFLEREGEHADHPGTGMGPSYQPNQVV